MVPMSNTASQIIGAFGGVVAMHDATGIPLNTIRTWAKTGVIGSPKTRDYEAKILTAAKELNLPIKPEDFVRAA
jgi:hypothetical protein